MINSRFMGAAAILVMMFCLGACAKAEPSALPTPPQETQEAKEEGGASANAAEDKKAESGGNAAAPDGGPSFAGVAVHDPSVIKADGAFYVFGSHLQAAKSEDLMVWTPISSGVYNGNPLIPNVKEEMAEAFEWGQTDTFWAGDVIQLTDGKYYMYYSVCKGDSPRAAIGLAVSDSIEGPYNNLGLFLKSGMWGQPSEDGIIYDATVHPNAIDPHVFFDNDGVLWLVYGSYSGGIYIMKLDPETGVPYPDQGYGKKLLGANHSRIEGPYIMYSPETDYYYLFLSYGGLDAIGGYNIRVARAKQPDGPYYDSEGQDLIEAKGPRGSFFDDRAIEPYGVKLMGGYLLRRQAGEAGGGIGAGYVSPGHNSAYYDGETGHYYLIFHTRFPYKGEAYEVRVHQMFMNEDGWPVVAPHRYAREEIAPYEKADIVGAYKAVNHGKDISAEVKESIVVELMEDGRITGEASGQWKLSGGYNAELLLDGMRYKGVFLRQWDEMAKREVMTFSVLSDNGTAVWGSAVAMKEQL